VRRLHGFRYRLAAFFFCKPVRCTRCNLRFWTLVGLSSRIKSD